MLNFEFVTWKSQLGAGNRCKPRAGKGMGLCFPRYPPLRTILRAFREGTST